MSSKKHICLVHSGSPDAVVVKSLLLRLRMVGVVRWRHYYVVRCRSVYLNDVISCISHTFTKTLRNFIINRNCSSGSDFAYTYSFPRSVVCATLSSVAFMSCSIRLIHLGAILADMCATKDTLC